MRVLVTGANGFVGSNLCAALLGDGVATRGLVREDSDLSFIAGLTDLEVMTGDITDPGSLDAAMKDIDIVYHVAALTSDWGPWESFRRINVEGVRNVMEAARASAVRRVVHISSVSVYGFPGRTDIPEDAAFVPRPGDPYITTKVEGERLALGYHGHGLEVTAIRPGGVFGPNDRTTTLQLAPELIGGKLPLVDGGRHRTAPVYIDNLVQMIRLAGDSDRAGGEAYNAVDDGRVTWREFFGWLCEDLGCAPPSKSFPAALAWPAAVVLETAAKLARRKESPPINKFRVRAVMADNHYSPDKARRELGYNPQISTREGLRRTAAWYRQYIGATITAAAA